MKAFQDIDQAVNHIRTFPDDAEEPEVTLASQQREVMNVVLFGPVDIWTLRKLAEQLRDRFLADPAITQVELANAPDYVTHVEIPQDRLREYGLTLGQVANIIRRSSEDVPAGTVETNAGEVLLRLKERRQWANDFSKIEIVSTRNGAAVTLGEIANITDGFEESGFHSQFNQMPSVEVDVFRVGEQSPLIIAERVESIMADVEITLPAGVQWRIDSNNARDYQQRLSLLLKNGFMAIGIVLLILSVFLEIRLAFWVMMGMTISFVGSILFLPAIGVSINMISMFAFPVVLGIVVDVEIVMRPPVEHNMSAGEMITLWRDQIGDIEGVSQITFEAERGPGGWRQDISIDLSHADIGVLEAASQALLLRLQAFKGATNVNDNYDKGKTQFDFSLLPEGKNLGLTPAYVGQQVRDAFYGALASRQIRGTDEIEVRVKLPKQDRKDIQSFADLVIMTPDGVEVPLMEVVEVKREVSRVLEAIQAETLPNLRADFPGLTWTFEGSQAELRESTAALWGSFGLAIAVVYALLAIAFGSYLQPLIVMAAIPFGVVGAIIGHIILGFDLSLISFMGVIALSGVVVNDALIMIDFANRLTSCRWLFHLVLESYLQLQSSCCWCRAST